MEVQFKTIKDFNDTVAFLTERGMGQLKPYPGYLLSPRGATNKDIEDGNLFTVEDTGFVCFTSDFQTYMATPGWEEEEEGHIPIQVADAQSTIVGELDITQQLIEAHVKGDSPIMVYKREVMRAVRAYESKLGCKHTMDAYFASAVSHAMNVNRLIRQVEHDLGEMEGLHDYIFQVAAETTDISEVRTKEALKTHYQNMIKMKVDDET